MNPNRALLPALGLALAIGGSAAAQTVAAQPTPEQAHALEEQITKHLQTSLAGIVAVPPRPVQLTAEGDHYLLRVPLAMLGKVDPPDAAFTAKARPLDGTRWALDDQQFPPLLTVVTTETVPDAPDAKNPMPDGTHKEAVTYRIKVGQQDVHGVFDTSFATPTTSGGTITSLDIEKEGGAAASLSHMNQLTTQSSTRPIDPAHADILSDLTGTGYSTKTALPDGSDFALQADRVHVTSGLTGLAHDQLLPLLHMASELYHLAKPPGDDDTNEMTPAQKAKLHQMLERAHNVLTGGKLDESIEGVKFSIADNTGALGKAQITFGGEAPADTLSASMGLLLDGLTIDTLPPQFAAYVPTHFAIHPTVGNVSLTALTKMGLEATAPTPNNQKAKVPQTDIAALFGKGGIQFGFDGLELNVAGASFTGSGMFTSTSPNPKSITGQAQLSARGLDALVAKAQSDPLLQQGVPVVIFLKGIARSSGDQSVWQITVNGPKVLVNGIDLSSIAGSLGK